MMDEERKNASFYFYNIENSSLRDVRLNTIIYNIGTTKSQLFVILSFNVGQLVTDGN